MADGEMELTVVLDVQGGVMTVRLPETSVETWGVPSLPDGMLPSTH